MRKINVTETLKAINFVTSVGVEEEVKEIAALLKSGKKINVREVGIQFVVGCVSKVTSDNAINRFFDILSGPFEMDADVLQAMPLEEFMPLFVDFLDTLDAENLKGFFKSVTVSIAKFK